MGAVALRIELERCTGCPGVAEPPCVRVCPGDLLRREEGKVRLLETDGCWDCASCVKLCPRGALALELSPELGGRGSRLFARTAGGRTRWLLYRAGGRVEEFET